MQKYKSFSKIFINGYVNFMHFFSFLRTLGTCWFISICSKEYILGSFANSYSLKLDNSL